MGRKCAKKAEDPPPLYRSDRGDICSNRILRLRGKLPDREDMTNTNPESAGIAPAGCVERWVQVDGLRVRFLHAGSGPAIVLVHGLLGYSFNWRRIVPLLSGRWQVFAPDLPGAGLSECDPSLDCQLSSAARRLSAFLDAVGVGSCDLIGSSYGGTTAVLVAAAAPARVRRLILVSPANPWSKIGRKRLVLLRNRLAASIFPQAGRALRPLHSFFVRRMYGDSRRATPDSLRGYSLPLMRPGIFEHAVRIVRTWQGDMQEFQAALPKLSDTPTLLVWGSHDRVVDPASIGPLSRSSGNVRTAVIRGAGHLPYEECPEEFAELIMNFLETGSPAISGRPTREAPTRPTREVT